MRKKIVILMLLLLLPLAFGISKPQLSSSTHPAQSEWSRDCNPIFKWNEVEGATGYSYEYDSLPATEPDSVIDLSETSYRAGCKKDGTWFFHIKACFGSSCSETSHYRVNIDRLAPSVVKNVTATPQKDGTIMVTWDAAEDRGESPSGIKGYNVYRDFTMELETNLSTLVSEEQESLSYHDKGKGIEGGLREGKTYFYKVSAIDRAGTNGPYSLLAFAEAASTCDLHFKSNLPAYTNTRDLEIEIREISSQTMYWPVLSVELPDGTAEELADGRTGTKLSTKYALTKEGTYNFVFLAADAAFGDLCDKNFYVVYDSTSPKVKVTYAPKGTVSGQTRFGAAVSDSGEYASGLDSINFSYSGAAEGTLFTEKSASGYVAKWNTLQVPNGTYTLTITATDKTGNISAKELNLTVNNIGNFFPSTDGNGETAPAEGSDDLTLLFVIFALILLAGTGIAAAYFLRRDLFDIGVAKAKEAFAAMKKPAKKTEKDEILGDMEAAERISERVRRRREREDTRNKSVEKPKPTAKAAPKPPAENKAPLTEKERLKKAILEEMREEMEK